MAQAFDAGYDAQPFRSLVEGYPDESVYPPADFRVEWGPIFHRGRLDGSAVVLVLGQDPAANETFVRRILVGVAGQRTQGLLAKLGVTRSYVMINAFLYSVYGQSGGSRHRNDPAIAAYRNQWLDALLVGRGVQAVIALGALADSAWQAWRSTPAGQSVQVAYQNVRHPTWPQSSSEGSAAKRKANTKIMLAQWNLALATLRPAITRPDVNIPLVPYGDDFVASELPNVPAFDIPAGIPAWMRDSDNWSRRKGDDEHAKRATLVVTVPDDSLPRGGIDREPIRSVRSPGRGPATLAPRFDPETQPRATAAPVDPAPKDRLALRGRVVTMDATRAVLDDAIVYVDGGSIVAVRPASATAPAGFTDLPVLRTGGTIYPGLIELHNHLPYNLLKLWKVPKKYTDRNVWRRSAAYHAAVVAPMSVIAREKALAPDLARYVECKALLGGVTTSQGITLINGGVSSKLRGLVRNVEQTDEAALAEAGSNVSDVGDLKGGLTDFIRKLTTAESRGACLLHHLSEGTDARSRAHFTSLRRPDGSWALSPAMVGIHSLALSPSDLDVMAQHGAAIVWSPLSNLLLYGDTAKIDQARARGIRVALGSDWSPTGSKNVLGELKAARAASDELKMGLSDRELVEMVTTTAASIVRWERLLGSVEAGKRADLLVLAGKAGDADGVYRKLVMAGEGDVALVVINGLRRYGTARLMAGVAGVLDAVKVGTSTRRLNLTNPQGAQFPDVTLTDATARLTEALASLPALAAEQRGEGPHPLTRSLGGVGALAAARAAASGFEIEFDELLGETEDAAPPGGRPGAPRGTSSALEALELDPLTVADDDEFLDTLAAQPNPSKAFKAALKKLYE